MIPETTAAPTDDTTLNDAPPVSTPPSPRFASDRPRYRTVTLEWPVEFDGKTYTEVTVRRLTAAEVATFAESPDRSTIPMFDVPNAVLDFLDDDDALEVNRAVSDFLPRRWRTVAEPQPDTPATMSP